MGNGSESRDTGDVDANRRTVLKLLGGAGVASLAGTSAVAADDPREIGFDPIDATIEEVTAAISSGDVTAREITRLYLDRIEAYDDALNTVIRINEDALERADELDEAFAEDGPVGPLHGVPITVKDIYDTGDMPTTAGSIALEGSQPEDDSYFVRRLREAGAIVLAKTNTHEFARGLTTISSLGGQTHNAYDLKRVPSGSSGGTASNVAANLSVFGTASDTGGSTRGPASVSNLVGLRPTLGVSSRDGVVPIAGTYDTTGVNTRTVAETALVFDLTAGYDPNDPITSRGVGNVPTEDSDHEKDSYVDFLDEDGLEGARIGIYREFFGTDFDELDEELEITEEHEREAARVTAVIEGAIEEMESLGATIVDPISIGPIEEVRELYDDGYYIQAEVQRSLDEYLGGLEDDVPNSVQELYESGLYACDIADSIEAAAEAPVETFEEDFRENVGRRSELRNLVLGTMAEEELDAVLYPSKALPPARIDDDVDGSRLTLSPNADMPAISVPAGFTEDDHLPVGLELLGRPFDEPLLLKLAYAFEQGTDHRRPPEGFGRLPGDPPETPEQGDVPIAADGCE